MAQEHLITPAGQPLLSVVIPTAGRRQWLARAVQSALQSAPNGNVEVIVVPNGGDRAWRDLADSLESDTRVRFAPIATPNANSARNHGMDLAAGKYVRFLDDDDYLLAAAAQQINVLEITNADVCSGLLSSIDQDGRDLGLLTAPKTRDFVSAAVGITGFALPTGHLFSRKSLVGCRWIETLKRRQDYAWLLTLAINRDWTWEHLEQPVGVWFQHDQQRTSTVKVGMEKDERIVQLLVALHTRLADEDRITCERRNAIAASLWHYTHSRFPYHPFYWSGVARQTLRIAPTSRPDHRLFSRSLKNVNPILLEWLLLPARQVSCLVREVVGSMAGRDYRRHL